MEATLQIALIKMLQTPSGPWQRRAAWRRWPREPGGPDSQQGHFIGLPPGPPQVATPWHSSLYITASPSLRKGHGKVGMMGTVGGHSRCESKSVVCAGHLDLWRSEEGRAGRIQRKCNTQREAPWLIAPQGHKDPLALGKGHFWVQLGKATPRPTRRSLLGWLEGCWVWETTHPRGNPRSRPRLQPPRTCSYPLFAPLCSMQG